MRKLINSTYVSLDGVIENPQDWPSLGSLSDEGYTIQHTLLSSCDAVLMGRRTYDGFAPVWSSMSGDPYSDRINAMTKYVFSSTLRDPAWTKTTVLDGDVATTVEAIKQQEGQDIVQYGFGMVSHALLAAGLIDELRLWLHPFFVGRGGADHLLYRDNVTALFDLVDTAVLDSGIALLTYSKATAKS
jgi:dihydrofolate reductase